MTQHPEDLPSNDSPADSDAPPGSEEPDPAEVDGDEDDPAQRDGSLRPRFSDVDENRRDSLAQRLSEEEPDRVAQFQEPEVGGLQAPESGDDDIQVLRGERDQDDLSDSLDQGAEDAAIHVIPENRGSR